MLNLEIYHFWKEEGKTAAVVLGLLMLQRIAEIIQEKKSQQKKQSPLNCRLVQTDIFCIAHLHKLYLVSHLTFLQQNNPINAIPCILSAL